MRGLKAFAFAMCAGVAIATMPAGPAAAETLTMWTMGQDQAAWVDWLNRATKEFEASNPGSKVEITFYDKSALRVALRTALPAGQGPDIFYTEPDQKEFSENGFLMPLNDMVDWNNIESWAPDAWSTDGKVWGLPLSFFTNELYYNADLMAELGVTIPENGLINQSEFFDILKKAKAANMEPLVVGAADRPFTGTYLTYEMLLKKLGPDDYRKLLTGTLSYADPRVVDVMKYVKQVIDMGAYPKSLATMTLTDSYAFFYNHRGLLFPQGTWYTQRAFVSPDKGGQPQGFKVGVMSFPTVDGGACDTCKTLAIGGGYAVNADTKNAGLIKAYFSKMATPEMGTLWTVTNYNQSVIKSDTSKVTGPYADYFTKLGKIREGSEYFSGIPLTYLDGQCRETYVQVMNVGFPAGLISVDDAISQMNAACFKG